MDGLENIRILTAATKACVDGDVAKAERLCATILKVRPNHVEALHLAAVIALNSERIADGAILLQRVLEIDWDYAPAYSTLGDALAAKGERLTAVAAFRRAVLLRANDAGLHIKLGRALNELSQFEQAEGVCRRAIELDPSCSEAHFNLAIALARQDRFEEAEGAFRTVISLDPHNADAFLNLGKVLIAQQRHDEAIAVCRRAVTLKPKFAAGYRNLALALRCCKQYDEAFKACLQAAVLEPRQAETHRALAEVLRDLGRFEDAAAADRYADELNSTDEMQEHVNDRAAASHGSAADPPDAKANPDVGAHDDLAIVLRDLGQVRAHAETARAAVEIDPNDPLARFDRALALLLDGDYLAGFREYEWRRRCSALPRKEQPLTAAEWRGEPLRGRTLLLHAEQGFGDSLQFLRFVPAVVAMGGAVVLQVQSALTRLVGSSLPDVRVIARGAPIPAHDLHLPLMSLPHILGITLDTIPTDAYLHAEPPKLADWRRRLPAGQTLKIGVAWAGNRGHRGDHRRSLSAAALLPRLLVPGTRLYSLQKDPRPVDCLTLAQLGSGITDLGPALHDFSDTAAATATLDLVIAVDTAVAHLAGGLGRPVWVLLPYDPDWRWQREREDSPWYPSMRLFRQHQPGNWDTTLARLPLELAKIVAGQREVLLPHVNVYGAQCATDVTPVIRRDRA